MAKPDQAAPLPTFDREHFDSVVRLANSGDARALAELRRILDERPEIWRQIGDLAVHAELTLLKALAGGDSLLFESIKRSMERLRQELLGPALEELAVSRVVACWLELHHITSLQPTLQGVELVQAKFVLKAKESAERCFQSALKTVSLTRHLLGPGKPGDQTAGHAYVSPPLRLVGGE